MKKIKLGIAIIVLVLLVLWFDVCFGLNRGEIREQIRYGIGDVTSTITTDDYRWSTDILNKRINIAQKEIAMETFCLSGRVLITPVTSYATYRLPTDLYVINRVSFFMIGSTEAYKRLEHWTMGGLDKRPTWENYAPGIPKKYIKRRNFIILHPTPLGIYCTTWALKIDYYSIPPDMDEDSDEPWDTDYALRGYHSLIIKAVVIMCLEDDNKPTGTKKTELDRLLKRMHDNIHKEEDPIQGGIDY